MAAKTYGILCHLDSESFDDALARVVASLQNEGFGVLTTIDVQETLKLKIGADFRRYVILGACNPTLAHRALVAEPEIGLLLPCNVVVQDSPRGGVDVAIADPRAMFSIVDNPALLSVVDEADARLRRVAGALGPTR